MILDFGESLKDNDEERKNGEETSPACWKELHNNKAGYKIGTNSHDITHYLMTQIHRN